LKYFLKNYQKMKQLFILSVLALVIYSCSNSDKPVSRFPDYPASVTSVKETVKGKSFSVAEVATISPFAMDKENPYDWMDGKKDSSDLTMQFRNDRLQMKLKFLNDTLVSLTDDYKTSEVAYRFDTTPGPAKKGNMALLLMIPNPSMLIPGTTEPMKMTYTYTIHGADDKRLFLETPRSFNNQKVVVLMKAD
jgi:hypothetical protein